MHPLDVFAGQSYGVPVDSECEECGDGGIVGSSVKTASHRHGRIGQRTTTERASAQAHAIPADLGIETVGCGRHIGGRVLAFDPTAGRTATGCSS